MSVDQYHPEGAYGSAQLPSAGQHPHAPRVTRSLTSTELVDHAGHLPEAMRRRASPARPPSRGGVLLTILLALLIVVLGAVSGGLYYLDQSYAGRIYPNVTVQGIRVGDLTPAAAEQALRARYGEFTSRPATITYGDRTWEPTIEELGVAFDFAGAVDAAYRAGRGNGLLANIMEVAAIWRDGLELPLRASYDETRAQQYLAAIAAELEQTPADAQLGLSGTQIWSRPSRTGLQVLIDPTLRELSAGITQFRPTTVQLQAREIHPRLGDTAVMSARQQLQALLQGPVTLTLEDREYVWPVQQIAGLIDIGRVPGDGSDRLVVTIDQPQIEQWLTQIADENEKPGVLPRLDWNGGDLKIIKPGVPGERLDEARSLELVLAALSQPARAIDLPVRAVDPPVTESNLRQLGIDELVSIGKSDFTGSADYRIHNIGIGMRLLHGILLAPGQEFSFNQNIGTIDAANGFVEGAAIIQNRTQQEFGGGICQDSTTIFRAAFWAGLPITERWGHSFYISWYDKYALGPEGNGPGLDATIFTGGPDLKFVNDTGAWMLIQAWSDPKTGIAQVELYGTKPNREVRLTGYRVYDRTPAPTEPVFAADPELPLGSFKQTDRARGGMTIDLYRVVTENGVQRAPELFRTRFRAWPNIFTLNPADIGPDGRPLISPQAPPDPNAQPVDPNAQPVDPNAQPAPVDPNAQPVDPNAQPAPVDPNAQPVDPNAPPTTDG